MKSLNSQNEDIKPENLMVSESGDLKYIDLGMVDQLDDDVE